MIATKRKRLGDMLVEVGMLSSEQLLEALQLQRETGQKLGHLLVEKGYVSEKQIIQALEQQMGIPRLLLDKYYIDPAVPPLIPESLARMHEMIPVKKEGSKLIVAMTDPLNIFAIDDVQIATGLLVEPAIAAKADVLKAVGLYYGRQSAERAIEEFQRESDNRATVDNDVEEETLQSAPIVRLVNTIITQAIRNAASDIHIEPLENEVVVRIRIDGSLQMLLTSAKSTHPAIVTRIKIMSKLDIAEKRLPQDGRFETTVEGSKVDMRVSILPTVLGEKIVIRLLSKKNKMITKSKLGFSEHNLIQFDKIIKSPTGLFLVTGPTGSGKTTTLYAILEELNNVEKNIVTVEDPVEYTIDGISQVQVNSKAGVTFAGSLSAILRQDPDIIMVGEIRDSQTCETAVRAAITGHLVLSTMHTNDTAATVARLVDMGIEPYLVAASLVGIVAQRLVRRICPHCETEVIPRKEDLQMLGIEDDNIKFYMGTGCPACKGAGYFGRTAVHEVMPISREIRSMIAGGAEIDLIRDGAIKNGMVTLKQNCIELVTDGITTVDEAVRVAYNIE